MRRFGDLELINGSILNARIEKLSSDPTFTSDDVGRLYYNLNTKTLRINNGVTYIDSSLPATFSNLIDALGTEWISDDLSFNPSAFNTLSNVGDLTANDSLFTVIRQLDNAIKNSNIGLLDLNDVVKTTELETGNVLYYNGTNFTFGTLDTLLNSYADLSLGNLSDVNLAGVSDGNFLVYDATSQRFVSTSPIRQYQDLTVSTQHTINHDFNVRYCEITVINMSNATKINDATITYVDVGVIQVTLNTPAPILAIVSAIPNLS